MEIPIAQFVGIVMRLGVTIWNAPLFEKTKYKIIQTVQ